MVCGKSLTKKKKNLTFPPNPQKFAGIYEKTPKQEKKKKSLQMPK